MSDNDYAWITQSIPTMTLRELYAGIAMITYSGDRYEHEDAAKWCRERADALIAELKREDSDE
jgi:hypothetical protein